jgi:hypothetical protein
MNIRNTSEEDTQKALKWIKENICNINPIY